MSVDNKYLYSASTSRIINLAIKIHKELGLGFIERIYEKALNHELIKNKIDFEKQKIIKVRYDNILLGDQRIDFLIEDKIVVELKAVSEINEIHISQMLSYLKTMSKKVGLILNFAKNKLDIKRVVL